jgi:hypothetical protein
MTDRGRGDVVTTAPADRATAPEPSGRGWGGASGPAVARLFHRALALIFLVAWLSLGSQIRLLIGSHGLLPWGEFVDAARAQGALSVLDFPSVLVLLPGDRALVAGTVLGVALALVALAGVRPRLCALLQTALYLGYVTACRGFLGFQWDNLLLECGLLTACLPTRRPAPLVHFLFRALLFKLYVESGIAKWQSPLGDWRDGSAMTFYYQTAPLPTAVAWYAHHLPPWWHLFESRATLVIELGIPFAAFGPRRARLGAAAILTLFQLLNMATANYGFFCPLTLALHAFLLDDADVARAWRRLARAAANPTRILRSRAPVAWAALERARRRLSAPTSPAATRAPRVRRVLAGVGAAAWLVLSAAEANFAFGEPGPATSALIPLLQLSQSFRVVNTYHLFAAITRARIEPELQLQVGSEWIAADLRYKAGDPARAPRFVAPHQPRVDFLLWFYGLAFQRRQPVYVANLLARLCEDPDAVATLFESHLPRAPAAVKIVFWDYRFTAPTEKRASGAWWTRREIGSTSTLPCARAR